MTSLASKEEELLRLWARVAALESGLPRGSGSYPHVDSSTPGVGTEPPVDVLPPMPGARGDDRSAPTRIDPVRGGGGGEHLLPRLMVLTRGLRHTHSRSHPVQDLPRMVVGQVLDPFNGGSADITFKDWLPSLQQAANWNQWSDAETLIQHLRGRALQEWTLRELLTYISHGILPDDEHKSRRIVLQHPLLAVVGGVLCYVDPKRKNRQRVAVPKSMQQRILEETHSGPFAAHFSVQRMFNTLVTSWWWEHMFEDAV